MSDNPILFSGPMVRALLAGTKTQTRRVINPQPEVNSAGLLVWKTPRLTAQTAPEGLAMHMRIAKGDRLYVREAWRCNGWATDVATIMYRASEGDGYTAMTEQFPVEGKKYQRVTGTWRPGIHMPRWASRITLTITDVRIEQLNRISLLDAKAEGAPGVEWDDWRDHGGPPNYRAGYREVWEKINGAGSWDANPWVAAYTFTVEQVNVAQARAA